MEGEATRTLHLKGLKENMQTKLTSIEATQSLLDKKKIPALDENQYQLLADYLFSANLPLRLQVAETVFRHDKRHPHALRLFLACTGLSTGHTICSRQVFHV
jgi:hypothetical protein